MVSVVVFDACSGMTISYCDSFSGDQFRSGWTKVVLWSEIELEMPTHGDTKIGSDVLPAV